MNTCYNKREEADNMIIMAFALVGMCIYVFCKIIKDWHDDDDK